MCASERERGSWDAPTQRRNTHAHFAQNLRMPTYHTGNRKELENKQMLAQKFTNSVNRPSLFGTTLTSRCICAKPWCLQEYGLASGPTDSSHSLHHLLLAFPLEIAPVCQLVLCSELFAAPGRSLRVLHPSFIWAASHSHNEPQHSSPVGSQESLSVRPHRPA